MSHEYTVTMRFQFPAWDEREGIPYTVNAGSKREAIKRARRQAEQDGHAVSGRGRYSFSAVQVQP